MYLLNVSDLFNKRLPKDMSFWIVALGKDTQMLESSIHLLVL